MVLVFTAVILFFTILFWTIERFNRVAKQGQACKFGKENDR